MNTEFQKRRTAFKIPIGLVAQGTLKLEKDPNDPAKERFNFLDFNGKEINRINIVANVIDKYQSEGEKNYASLTIDDGTGTMRIRAFSDTTAMIKEIELGTTILIIGTLRYYNNEIYILPEIIKKLDPRWLLARKLELEKEFGDTYKELNPVDKPFTPQPISTQQTQQQMQPQTQPQMHQQTQPIQSAQQVNTEINTKIETEKVQEVEEVQEVQEEKIVTEKIEQTEDDRPSIREEILKLIRDAEAEQGIGIDKVIMQLSHQPVEVIKSTITELLEGGEIFEPQPGKLRIL